MTPKLQKTSQPQHFITSGGTGGKVLKTETWSYKPQTATIHNFRPRHAIMALRQPRGVKVS
jgi:hypothetical protein